MGQTVSGTFIMDNGIAANIAIGFIPDYVKLISNLEGGTAEVLFEWWRALADLGDLGVYTEGRYGISRDHAGDVTVPTTAATGIIPYDGKKTPMVLIESPSTGKLTKTVLGVKTAVAGVRNVDYNPLTNYTTYAVDRSATVIGTIIRPTVHNGYVYEMKTKTGGAAGTEPTWGTVPGETTTDTIGNVWICREENIVNAGGLGFTVGADINVDSDQCIFTAEKHLRYGDMGDAASADPVTFL